MFMVCKYWRVYSNFYVRKTLVWISCRWNKISGKNIAKSKWLIGCKKKHKDNIASLEMLFSCDDCELIKKIGKWEITLTLDNKFIGENNYPDWYGYQKIDRK